MIDIGFINSGADHDMMFASTVTVDCEYRLISVTDSLFLLTGNNSGVNMFRAVAEEIQNG